MLQYLNKYLTGNTAKRKIVDLRKMEHNYIFVMENIKEEVMKVEGKTAKLIGIREVTKNMVKNGIKINQ